MRHVDAFEFRQDHLLHLKGNNGGSVLAFRNPRDLHQNGNGEVFATDAP
jgi:hypothetical protein